MHADQVVRVARIGWSVAVVAIGIAIAGCDGGSGAVRVVEGPKVVPTINPDANSPARDVTIENEYQNLDKIRARSPAKRKR
jgi:hypothetical protein